jgi:hypothetical protein
MMEPLDETDLDEFCQRITGQLDAAGVRRRVWACGQLRDDCNCIVRDGDIWKIGFFERGRFDVYDETPSDETAIALFTELVTRMDRIALRNTESTKAWMKRRGLKRP